MKGVNQEDYKIDLSQCQAYADEVEVGKQWANNELISSEQKLIKLLENVKKYLYELMP